MALKQLACLQEDLARYGVSSQFTLRVEDLTDYWLFDDEPHSNAQVDFYAAILDALGKKILAPNTWSAVKETSIVSKAEFFHKAAGAEALFYAYLSNSGEAAKAFSEL